MPLRRHLMKPSRVSYSYIDSWLKDLTDEDFTNAVKECVKVVNYFLGGQKESEKKQEVDKVA